MTTTVTLCDVQQRVNIAM